MLKLPQYLSFFEPILFGILFCFLPELEYFFFPTEDKYSGPMVYLFVVVWAISIFIISLPLKQLVKDKFHLTTATQNYWLRNIGKRNPNLDQILVAKLYKFPSVVQLIFPVLLMAGGVIWLIYPILTGKNAVYPYAIFPFFLGYKGASTMIKYNNIDSHKE